MGASLTLTVLGTSGSYPGPGQACSGYLVQAGDTTVWLDAGPGTLANLQRHIGLADIDAIVLTHAHPDHWTDVLGFHVACKWYVDLEGVPVHSPADVRRLASAFHDELGPTLDWRDIADGVRLDIGPLAFRFSRTDHPGETLAVRIDADGRSLAYTADTGNGWSLRSLGEELDLVLAEATLGVDQEGESQHLSARQAGAMASEAGAARLVLTHLQPGLDPDESHAAATGTFTGAVEVAAVDARYEV